MPKLTANRLTDLRAVDLVHAVDGRALPRPATVASALGYIEPGSAVKGVRLVNPRPASGLELVYYPNQMTGRPLDILRSGA